MECNELEGKYVQLHHEKLMDEARYNAVCEELREEMDSHKKTTQYSQEAESKNTMNH